MKRMFILLLLALVTAGCSNVYNHEEGYRMAHINSGFPVPKNAYEINPEDCVGEISKAAKYELKGIGDEDGNPQEQYLQTIEEWGWTDQVEQRRGAIHYYEKNGKVMLLNIHRDVFDVFEVVENPALRIGE